MKIYQPKTDDLWVFSDDNNIVGHLTGNVLQDYIAKSKTETSTGEWFIDLLKKYENTLDFNIEKLIFEFNERRII